MPQISERASDTRSCVDGVFIDPREVPPYISRTWCATLNFSVAHHIPWWYGRRSLRVDAPPSTHKPVCALSPALSVTRSPCVDSDKHIHVYAHTR